jgi:hypothetical protein
MENFGCCPFFQHFSWLEFLWIDYQNFALVHITMNYNSKLNFSLGMRNVKGGANFNVKPMGWQPPIRGTN